MNAICVAATRQQSHHTNGLITLQIECPEFLHAQLLRHRRASPNWVSHRVGNIAAHLSYHLPEIWYAPAKGMQTGGPLPRWKQFIVRRIAAACNAGNRLAVRMLTRLGACASQASRYNNHTHEMIGIITATEPAWAGLLALRLASDADPEMRVLATLIEAALDRPEWRVSPYHLPFYDATLDGGQPILDTIKVCAARIARVSWGSAGRQAGDLRLGARLIRDKHWSPFDQCAVWKVNRELRISPICSLPEDVVWSGDTEGLWRSWAGWLPARQLFDTTPAFSLDRMGVGQLPLVA